MGTFDDLARLECRYMGDKYFRLPSGTFSIQGGIRVYLGHGEGDSLHDGHTATFVLLRGCVVGEYEDIRVQMGRCNLFGE